MSPTKRTVKKRPSAKDAGRIVRPPAVPARGKGGAGQEGNLSAEDTGRMAKVPGASPRPQRPGEDAGEGSGVEQRPSRRSGGRPRRKAGQAATKGEGQPEAQDGSSRAEDAGARGRRAAKHRRWPKVVAAVLAFAVVACGAVFSWDRWLRYDDAADFQGAWLTSSADAGAAVQISADEIRLTDDVAYAYALDPGSKTITFAFGDLSGSGRYRFSADRTQVAIIEGGDYSWISTLSDDMAWGVWSLACAVQGQPAPSPAEGAQATILFRSGAVAAADGQDAAGDAAADGAGADAAADGADTAAADALGAADTADAAGTADAGA